MSIGVDDNGGQTASEHQAPAGPGFPRSSNIALIRCLLAATLLVAGCTNSGNPTDGSSTQGVVRLLMVGGPASFDAVNLVVTEVSVQTSSGVMPSAWVVLDNTVRTFDLVRLVNGATGTLTEKTIDVGGYSAIRLKLGTGSTVVQGGVPSALDVSGLSSNGIILNTPFTISSNAVTELLLDFDPSHSVLTTQAGQFVLSPNVRVVSENAAGSVSGIISPLDARATVSTTSGSDTLSVVSDSLSGSFQLEAVPVGSYAIRITALQPVYADTTILGVSVSAGQTKALGVITLHLR